MPMTIPPIAPPEICFGGTRLVDVGLMMDDAVGLVADETPEAIGDENAVLDGLLGALVIIPEAVPGPKKEVTKGEADADTMASPAVSSESIVLIPRAWNSLLTASASEVLPPLGFANGPMQTLTIVAPSAHNSELGQHQATRS